MEFNVTKDWLLKRISEADDSRVAAGGSSLQDLKKEVQARRITPAVIESVPSAVGRVVRIGREQRGWTQADLAEVARVDASEILAIEAEVEPQLEPRTVIYVANALGFSEAMMKRLAGHSLEKASDISAEYGEWEKYAAYSAPGQSTSAEEFEAICALVDILSRKSDE